MFSIVLDLAQILPTIRCPGYFYATGTTAMFAPNLEIDGVGRISLPLLPAQAEQLVTGATRAQYGRGEETVVDTRVRRTWQIDADRIRIGGGHWMQTLDAIVAKAAVRLGVDGSVSADFYKLLIYDTGSFFVEHRDTEKCRRDVCHARDCATLKLQRGSIAHTVSQPGGVPRPVHSGPCRGRLCRVLCRLYA